MTFDEITENWSATLPKDDFPSPMELKERALRAASRAEWKATIFEVWGIAVFALLGGATLIDAIHGGEPVHCYLSPVVTLAIAIYLFAGRRQRKRETSLSGSLTEILDSRIGALDRQINRVNSFLWWCFVPAALAAIFGAVFSIGEKPLWTWAILPLGVAAFWLAMMMAIKDSHVPHRNTLKVLREQLSPEQPS